MGASPFLGRSLTAIRDFNRDERLYIYGLTRRLKEALAAGDAGTIDAFRIDDADFGMYEIFLEDSTRTRESFKNAGLFHRIRLSELNAGSSSFNKKESYADTIANLVGYGNHVFVLRTALEGVCRHLDEQTERYRRRHGIPGRVSFINAGDGRHEHPTQELLDEFTFLEDLAWSPRRIHLALVGDLYHGRTVHSKVHGLDLFESVAVDLVAPPELAMPRSYVAAMEEQGFRVREFASIEEYLSAAGAGAPGAGAGGRGVASDAAAGASPGGDCGGIAPQWYFTRPQLERMGDRVLRRQEQLRQAITFSPEMIDRVSPRTKFYHPLPRHREHPTIPVALDDTHLNGWERQSANGYLIRIVLLALVAGRLGHDYEGPVGPAVPEEYPFTAEVAPDRSGPKRYSEGVRPISDGIVIDHISCGDDPEEIRRHIATLLSVVGLHGRGGEWVSTGRDGRAKGIIFRPDVADLSDRHISMLAAIVPGATVNVISDGTVRRKIRLSSPRRIFGIPALRCRNAACITAPEHGEQILPSFLRTGADRYACEYCSHDHGFKELWK
jgi:aspartate carbamoyltransferase